MTNKEDKKEKFAEILYSVMGSSFSPHEDRGHFINFFNNYFHVKERLECIERDRAHLQNFFTKNTFVSSFTLQVYYDDAEDYYKVEKVEVEYREEAAPEIKMSVETSIINMVHYLSFFKGEIFYGSCHDSDTPLTFTPENFKEILNIGISETELKDFEMLEYYEKHHLSQNLIKKESADTYKIQKI